MKPIRMVPLLSVSLLCAPALAGAQTCFRGRPLPTCKTFWITESGLGTRVNRGPGGASADLFATLEIGRMSNRSDRTALGATVLVGVGDQISSSTDVMLGFKPRYRHWLGPTTSLELSPGVFYSVVAGRVGLTAHAAINLADRVALTGQVLAARSAISGLTTRTDVGWYIGGKLGAWPGVAAAIVVPVVFCIVLCGSVD
jgi:hypothetical protein